jgi:protein-L-isoaspartate O-methyltransferase
MSATAGSGPGNRHGDGHRPRDRAADYSARLCQAHFGHPGLAERLAANLRGQRNVRVMQGDGARVPFDPAYAILVNAGATRPADAWLDGLRDGGRLILPLTASGFPNTDFRKGAVFRILRQGKDFLGKRSVKGASR